jgi:RNA polymerase sigma-70 factor (ECF subfamily)
MQGHAEEDPLTELYRRYSPAIFRRALGMLQDKEEALDVTQDTFLDYMRGAASLRGEATPFTVLYQIATYKAVDRLRRRSRWSGTLGSLDVPDEEDPAPQSTWLLSHEGGMNRVEALRDLALLTEGESPQTLTAAFLYFVEDHSLEAVGRVLDLERHQVSKLLRQFAERARKRSARFDRGGTS